MGEVELITGKGDFASLREQWDEAVAAMEGANPFLAHVWLTAWCRHLAPEAKLRVFVVRNGDRLLAAAPLALVRERYYGVPLRALIWIGDRASDRLQFVARTEAKGAAAALWTRIREHREGQALVRLEEVPAGSLTDHTVAVGGGRVGRELSSVLPYVDLSRSWEEFEAQLPRKFRSELRTRTRVFDQWGRWKLAVTRGAETARQLGRAAAVEQESAKVAGGYALLADPAQQAFLAEVLAGEDWGVEPVLFHLEVDDAWVAYLLGFVHHSALCAYNMAYRTSYEKGSPGKWLFQEAMRWAHAQGLATFDFLRGANYMKSRWRPERCRNCRLVAFAGGPLPAALHAAVFSLRPRLKRLRDRQAAAGRDRDDTT